MLYRRIPVWAGVVALALAAVFVAGFFRASEAGDAAPAPSATVSQDRKFARRGASMERVDAFQLAAKCDSVAGAYGGSPNFHVPTHLYRRAGEVSSKVESVIKAYKEIDGRMKSFGGEITEMEIVGSDEGRQGRIAVTVSTDRFNDFIDYSRGLGKVLSERITASARPKADGKGGKNVPSEDDVDPRELSIVTLSLVDEKIAKEVHQSRGMLATSFNRSASHFLAGMAVMVELFGWIAPYAIILGLVVVPIVVVRRFRRQPQEMSLGAEQIIR